MNPDATRAGPMTLPELMAARAQALGDAPALLAPGREPTTFSALEQIRREIEAQLRARGIGRSHTVALALPNGPDAASAFLGCACAAICAPLNPALKHDELAYLLADMEAKAVVLAAGAEHPARGLAARLGAVVLEVAPQARAGAFRLMGEGSANFADSGAAPPRPQDAALVLYTSGTTSHPKRVTLTHANLLAGAGFTARAMGIAPGDVCLNIMPLYHAHGLTSTVLASVVGSGAVVATEGFIPERFFEWMNTFEPTWYSGVPAMHQAIVTRAPQARAVLERVRLRVVRSASAPLPVDLLGALERTFDAPVVEAYGMTEATSLVSANPLPPGIRKAGSVGVSAGCAIAILDEVGGALGAGEAGEIAIRGPNVFSGYGNAPDANASAFVDGWFRTGDYGLLDGDGYLFILGRTKELINRGGSKLLPSEVDEALRRHPDVAEVAAFGLPHPTLGEDVAAAVVPRRGATISIPALQAFVRERLAEFKTPSRIFVVDALPKTATGKVRRVELARAMAGRTDAVHRTPSHGDEREIARIWADLLGREPGAGDNFFDLGGNSILLTELHARLVARWGRPADLLALIDHPTVEAQARLIAADEVAAAPAAPKADRSKLLQRRGALARAATDQG